MSMNWSLGDCQPSWVSDPKLGHGSYESQGEMFHDHPLDHPALHHDESEQLTLEPVQHLWSDHVDSIN